MILSVRSWLNRFVFIVLFALLTVIFYEGFHLRRTGCRH